MKRPGGDNLNRRSLTMEPSPWVWVGIAYVSCCCFSISQKTGRQNRFESASCLTTFQEALERNQWKKVATARELGIDKNTLRRKIKRLGIIESH